MKVNESASEAIFCCWCPLRIKFNRRVASHKVFKGRSIPGWTQFWLIIRRARLGRLRASVRDKNDGDYLIAKLDHSLTNNELLTGRYAFARNYQVFPFGSPGGFGAGSRLPQFA